MLSWDILLPILIFVAEITVVTLSTVRIIFLSRGLKGMAALLGFFEICIWLFAIGQIMQNLSNVSCYLAFAGGFTFGNYLGVVIDEKLAMGNLVVRVITCRDGMPLCEMLRSAGFGVTCLDARGATGPVQVLLTVIKRKDFNQIVSLIHRFDPKVFYSVDPVQSTAEGVFPASPPGGTSLLGSLLKGKQRTREVAGSSSFGLEM